MSTPIALLNQSITNLGTAVGNMNRANAEQNNNLRPGFTAIATSLEGLKTKVMNLIASVRQLGNYIKQLESERGANISDIGTNTEDANELRRQIAQLRQDYNTLRQELLDTQQQNATLKNNLNTVTQNLNQCNTEKDQLQKQITAMQAEIDRLNNLPKPDPQEIQQLKAEVQRLNYEIQQRQQELENLKNVVIPGLQKDIADLKALIAPLQKEVTDLKASIVPLQQQIAKCNTDLEAANRNIAALQAQNRDLTDQITASTAAINKIIATINTSGFKLDPNLTQDITLQRDELARQIGQLEVIVNSLLPGSSSSSSSSSGRGFSPKVANVSKASSETRALPTGWYSAVDPETGTTYYINDTTKKSQWDFPVIPSSTSSSSSSSSSLSSSSSGKYGSFLDEEPSDSSSSGENTPPSRSARSSMRRPTSKSYSSSSNMSDIFGTSTSNAYGQPVNVSSNLSKQPSLLSSSNVVGTLNNPTTPITINGINTNLGELKAALLNKGRTQTSITNRYNTANRALNTINNESEVPQIFTANKINVSGKSGNIILSPMAIGGKKSKKTKNKRKIIKQKGGFEYSGKSKRRRFSVTRSSSSPRSSQSRSSSQRSSYETQSIMPPKYRARGTKKSKM
jgi:predicted  nucleic acid-binding Zn-ribbon protein